MATTKPAPATRPLQRTGRSLKPIPPAGNTAGSAVETVTEMSGRPGSQDVADLVDAIRAMQARDGREIGIAGARACALVARSLLEESSHDYYSRLLAAARRIERAVPGQADLARAVKRVLGAGDRADGPVNGPDKVVEAMEAEAACMDEDDRRDR